MVDSGHEPTHKDIGSRRGLLRLWLVGSFTWFLFAIVFFDEEISDWLSYDIGLAKVVLFLFWPVAVYPSTRWIMKGFMRQYSPQNASSRERSWKISDFATLFVQHPALSLVGVVLVIAVVAIWIMEEIGHVRPIEYEEGFGKALAYTLMSPFQAIPGAVGTLLFARAFVRSWQSYWVAYRATLLAGLLCGVVAMLGWAFAALMDSEIVGMAFAIPFLFFGRAWVFSQFLQRSDGSPVGLLVGAKIVGVEMVVIILLYFAFAVFLFGPSLS